MSEHEPKLEIEIAAFTNKYHFKVKMQNKDAKFTFKDLADLVDVCTLLHPDDNISGELKPYTVEKYGEIVWAYRLHIDSENMEELNSFVGVVPYFGSIKDGHLSTPVCLNEFSTRLKQEPDVLDICIVDTPYSMSINL